jgi:hypothetical protein
MKYLEQSKVASLFLIFLAALFCQFPAKGDVGTMLVGDLIDELNTTVTNVNTQLGMSSSHIGSHLNVLISNLRYAYRDELGLTLDNISNERRKALEEVKTTFAKILEMSSENLERHIVELDNVVASVERSLGVSMFWIGSIKGNIYEVDTNASKQITLRVKGRGIGGTNSDYRSEVEVWVNGRNALINRSVMGSNEARLKVDRTIVAENSHDENGVLVTDAVLKVKYYVMKKILFFNLGVEYSEITLPFKLVGYGNVIGSVVIDGLQPVYVLKYERTETREYTSTSNHCEKNCDSHYGQTNCWSWATSNPDEVLYDPTIRCFDGPCEFNYEYPPQLTDGNKSVTWCYQSRTWPTRWRMTVNVGRMMVDAYSVYRQGLPLTTSEPVRLRVPKSVTGAVVIMKVYGIGIIQFGLDQQPTTSRIKVLQNEIRDGELHVMYMMDPTIFEEI